MTEQETKIAVTLRDAGCSEAEIGKFLEFKASGNNEEALKVLSVHRCSLLCRIHEAQKPVDILDYFLLEMKKEQQTKD